MMIFRSRTLRNQSMIQINMQPVW